MFTSDPAEYKNNLGLKINNTALPMATHPQILGLTLDQKLTYSTHNHNISIHAHKPLQIIKTLTTTGWGKKKRTLVVTYKAVMRSALEYASSIWSPLSSSTSINKLQVMQNAALGTATGCTQDTSEQRNTHTSHTRSPTASRLRIKTENTTSITSLTQIYFQHYKAQMHLATSGNNKTLDTPPPHMSSSEYFPASLVTPVSNSEPINNHFPNHAYTNSMPTSEHKTQVIPRSQS